MASRGWSSTIWYVVVGLAAVFTLLTVFSLVPGQGRWRQGVWPELYGFHLRTAARFPDFATDVRVYSSAAVVAIWAVAVGFVWRIDAAWQARLRRFVVNDVLGYRAFVGRRAALHTVVATVLAVLLMASVWWSDWGMPLASWVWLLLAAVLVSLSSFVLVMFIRPKWRQLFFGR